MEISGYCRVNQRRVRNNRLTSMDEEIKKIYTFYNSSFVKLKDNFLRSIKDDFMVEAVFMDIPASGKLAGGFQIWKFKTKIIIDAIRKNFGKIILVADIDIEFLKPVKGIIREYIRDNDIVFQRNPQPSEGPINIGFMAIRCNRKVLIFWNTVLLLVTLLKRHDQLIVDILLIGKLKLFSRYLLRIKYGYFPLEIWANGPGEDWNRKIPKEISLFHATWVVSQEEKLALMNKIPRLI